MSTPIPNSRLGRAVAIAGLILGAAAFMSTALCLADQVTANVRQPVNTSANGVTDTALGTIDLAKESIKAERPLQRARKLVAAPGGVVPWYSHIDRSAQIYDSEGELDKYNSNCSVPIMPWDCVLDPVRVRPSWSEP